MRDAIIATYRLGLAPNDDVEKKAQAIALGQTVGSWTPLQQADPQQWERHRGEVVKTDRTTDGTGIVQIAFPAANCEGDIPTILTMVFGKVSLDGRIKLLGLSFPPSILSKCPGPKIGIEGLRQRLHEPRRPLTMAIFKPCVGLSSVQLGEMFYALAVGGLDVVKDDEILPDLEAAPTEQRLESCLKAAERARRQTGRMTLYAVNLTGPANALRERALRLQSLGANCFLFNVLAYGWSTFQMLTNDPAITTPFMAHPALAGGLCGAPEHGMSYGLVLGTLMRLAGADIVLYPAHYGTFPFPAEDEFAIRDALRSDWKGSAITRAWPGPSVGIHPGMVPHVLRDYGHDVIINAGGGIHGHPDGTLAGATAMRQAVDLALEGASFPDGVPPAYAELHKAIEHWGVK